LLPATGFSELIGEPFGRRVRGHSKPWDLPSAMAYDQQPIEQSERDYRHDEEVHCDPHSDSIPVVVPVAKPIRLAVDRESGDAVA